MVLFAVRFLEVAARKGTWMAEVVAGAEVGHPNADPIGELLAPSTLPDTYPGVGPPISPAADTRTDAHDDDDPSHRRRGGREATMGIDDFQIVPLAGLPIVAVALVGLVVAIASNTLWGLDFFHVAAGGLWTGIDLFLGFIVGPVLGRMSVAARAEFSRRFMPKMVLVMPTLVVCTLAAGWQLARHQGNLSAAYPEHAWLIASMVVVGAMAVIALGILEPANLAVLFELKKPSPNGALIGTLMKRFIYTAGVTGALQIATLIIMTKLASS